MNDNQKTIVKGVWLYDDSVPCAVYLIKRNIAYGTGDYEDPESIRNDREGLFYYIQYEAAGEPGNIKSETGPFETIEEAKKHAHENSNGTIQWQQ